jgi:hypothetical protein
MKPLRWCPGQLWALLILVLVPTAVSAQLIPLKTVPIATEDQFLIFPSRNLAD